MSEVTEKSSGSEDKKKNRFVILIILLLLLIVILLVIVIVKLTMKESAMSTADNQQNTERREVAGSVRTVLDESATEDVMSQMREEVAEGMFECKMSMKWTFQNGESDAPNSYVANSLSNTHPICFDVIMEDSGETIYSSPVMPVGTELTNIRLDKVLPAGTYEATVMYQLLKDAESQEPISSAGFIITIEILN